MTAAVDTGERWRLAGIADFCQAFPSANFYVSEESVNAVGLSR
jgi:hypothetical protein